jgi:hypothetical protein
MAESWKQGCVGSDPRKEKKKKKPMEKADLGRAVVDKAGYDLISSGF